MLQSLMLKLGLTLLLSFTGTDAPDEQAQKNSVPLNQASQVQIDDQFQAQFNEITSKMVVTSPLSRDTVQVFDVKQGHVIKSVENSNKIQKQTKRILKEIYEFAPEIQPDMSAKYIIRIPVKSGTEINVNNTSIEINELFIFYYPNKEPLVLVFDTNKRPYLFHTKQSLAPLLKLIQVE